MARKRQTADAVSWSFEYVGDGSGEPGRFQTQDAAGREVCVESGSVYETSDASVAMRLRESPFVREA